MPIQDYILAWLQAGEPFHFTTKRRRVKTMTTTAALHSAQITPEAGAFTKRIGYTTYRVGVHFSEASKETAQDKILRLVKNEAAARKEAGP